MKDKIIIKSLIDFKDPNDLKKLSDENVDDLVNQARKMIIDVSLKNGGHYGANTSILETTVGILRVLDLPKDKVLFDIGHNCYPFKLFTGRAARFHELRNIDGIKGFQDINESKYDQINQGNAGTAPSNALGMAAVAKKDEVIVSIIGDSSFGNGTVYEFLNHSVHINHPLIIVVNDNAASIGPIMGGLAKWHDNKNLALDQKLPKLANIFDFEYIGPINGHDWKEVKIAIQKAKELNKKVIVHVKTKKGYGIEGYENDWGGAKMHAIGRPNRSQKWDNFISDIILNKMRKNDNIDLVSSAMLFPMKYNKILGDSKVKNVGKNDYEFQSRVYNVGIAEGHASSFAAGLALAGRLPFVPYQSAFSRRAFDHILHDIALLNSHVVFQIAEAGTIENGNTHHGFYDFQMFNSMPNTHILFPSNLEEMKIAFDIAFDKKNKGIWVVRHTKYATIFEIEQKTDKKVKLHKPTWFKYPNPLNEKSKVAIISYGQTLARVRDIVNNEKLNIDLVNAFWHKPIDVKMLKSVVHHYDKVILLEDTLEDHGIDILISRHIDIQKIEKWMYPKDEDIPFGKEETVRQKYSLDHESLRQRLLKL